MAQKAKAVFVCAECGSESPKWYGKCPSCGQWNTMNEEVRAPQRAAAPAGASSAVRAQPRRIGDINPEGEQRYKTGLKELDRVLGGGIVRGGLMLIGGDPGIGKSTLLLQICEHLGQRLNILYVSGEESARQLKLRADRLGVHSERLFVLCETDVGAIIETIFSEKPDIVIIDSIQTMSLADVASSPGSVTQVRECTSAIMRAAKSVDTPVFIVGHVNKDGAIAGPKVMEHIVDCVLYFEGDRHTSYRMLRCVKNRYGSTNEIGVFEMRDKGLAEVENPSLMMLSGRLTNVSGTCVACAMEGSRPLLAEVQGLVSPTGFGNPGGCPPALTTTASISCWRCWKSGRAISSPTWTPTSTSSAVSGWTSPQPICRWPCPWCPASRTRRWGRGSWPSARWAWPARCGRFPTPKPASGKPPAWASPRSSCPIIT